MRERLFCYGAQYPWSMVRMRCRSGSSPRVWGIRKTRKLNDGELRFIPTRVGNTLQDGQGHPIPSVHPHACGEYAHRSAGVIPSTGSSPRVWGILRDDQHEDHGDRFIPTRVGNTAGLSGLRAGHPVHPHACGEYIHGARERIAGGGSSPRVWGIRRGRRGRAHCQRFIPTRVGNTESPQRSLGRLPVHPHACGEYSSGRCKK